MDYGAMIEMRDKLIAERDAANKLIAALEDAIGLGARIGAPVRHGGQPLAPPATTIQGRRSRSGKPTGAEAIFRILQDAPGVEMDVKAILGALNEHGWAPNSTWPENVTSSNAARAVQLHPDELTRRRAGAGFLYRYGAARLDLPAGAPSVSTNGHHAEGVMA